MKKKEHKGEFILFFQEGFKKQTQLLLVRYNTRETYKFPFLSTYKLDQN